MTVALTDPNLDRGPVTWAAMVGIMLADAALAAHMTRDILQFDPLVRGLTSEVSGLLDALTGVVLTNQEERIQHHVDAIMRLRADLVAGAVPAPAGTT